MQMSPYWRAVWEVALFLLAISLLSMLSAMIFGLLAFGPLLAIFALLQSLVPLVGALVYLDWRWGWRADTIGLLGGRHLRWLPAGLGLGVLALLLTHALSALVGAPLLPSVAPTLASGLAALPVLLGALTVELLFRGGATARLQADLPPKEAMLTALALPLVASALSGFLFSIPTGIGAPWTLFFTAAQTLLYLRMGELWLNIGLSVAVVVLPGALGLSLSGDMALLLWLVVAVVLGLLGWKRIDRMPRRVGPRRGPRSFH